MFWLFGHPVQSKVKGISQSTHRHRSALISADAFQLAVYLEKTLAKSDQVWPKSRVPLNRPNSRVGWNGDRRKVGTSFEIYSSGRGGYLRTHKIYSRQEGEVR